MLLLWHQGHLYHDVYSEIIKYYNGHLSHLGVLIYTINMNHVYWIGSRQYHHIECTCFGRDFVELQLLLLYHNTI